MKWIVTLFLTTVFAQFLTAQLAVTTSNWDQQHFPNGSPELNKLYVIQGIDVEADIKDHVAEVSVSQTIKNAQNHDLEVEVLFPLPNNGVVQNFMLMVDGQEIPGELMSKDEAKSIYEGIVRRKRDPALMEYVGYGLFKTSVFPIPVGKSRKITIRYTHLCHKKHGTMQYIYPIGTQKFSSQAIPEVNINARIRTTVDIKSVFTPNPGVKIEKVNERFSKVTFKAKNIKPSTDFKLNYNLDNEDVGGSLYSHKASKDELGHFMFLASPKVEVKETEKTSKNVVFVLDKSGSMSGKKIEQAKSALEYVLANLKDGDLFNMVIYDDRIEPYKNELIKYDRASYKEASAYASTIVHNGGTNIEGALKKSLELMPDNGNPNYLIFLTDGLPTAGVTNETQIVQNVEKYNDKNTRIFCFGVGNNVNARLLDKLSTQNGGLTEYVKPDEDVEASVSSLFNSISSPVMTDINIKVTGVEVSQTYPTNLPDMFKGSQFEYYGRYKKGGKATVIMTGKIQGESRTFEFPVEFASVADGDAHSYVDAIWANNRVAHLLTLIDQNGKNDELVNELIDLSKRYGILTPYTAFLAKEDVDFAQRDVIQTRSLNNLQVLDDVSGEEANAVRKYKNDLKTTNSFSGGGIVDAEMEPIKDESVVYATNSKGKKTVVNTVKKVHNKTFYWKKNNWVDGSISSDLTSAKKIKKFSEAYFKLGEDKASEFKKYLSIKEDFYLKIGKTIYYFHD